MAQQEIRWEYDVVEVGQAGPPIVVEVTEELISRYAKAVRNDNPAYHTSSGEPANGVESLAMPTMPDVKLQ